MCSIFSITSGDHNEWIQVAVLVCSNTALKNILFDSIEIYSLVTPIPTPCCE